MLITSRRRRWLRILGTWPLVYVCAFVVAFYSLDFRGKPLPAPELLVPALFVVHLGTILLAYVVLITCLIYLIKSAHFALWTKVIWTVSLVLATIVVVPLFVWWQVMPDETVSEASGGAAPGSLGRRTSGCS